MPPASLAIARTWITPVALSLPVHRHRKASAAWSQHSKRPLALGEAPQEDAHPLRPRISLPRKGDQRSVRKIPCSGGVSAPAAPPYMQTDPVKNLAAHIFGWRERARYWRYLRPVVGDTGQEARCEVSDSACREDHRPAEAGCLREGTGAV